MTIYISLLRGINVGGKNKIKMADLKRMFEGLGFDRVQTYIQSGNVLFESTDGEEELRKRIEHEIQAVFGLTITVILRTAAEWERIISDCPYSAEEIAEAEAATDVECFYVCLLPEAPAPEGIERINAYRNESDDFRIVGRELYLLLRHSPRDSKLLMHIHKLGVQNTMRNWNTVNKLNSLAQAMEA